MINHASLTLPDRRIISVVLFYPPLASANSADDQPWSYFSPLLRRPLGGFNKEKKTNKQKTTRRQQQKQQQRKKMNQ